MLFTLHLAAVALAALALWLTRHELAETAATRWEWALPAALAIVVAAILLGVSPGKRIAFWVVTIGAGLALGVAAGLLLGLVQKVERDTATSCCACGAPGTAPPRPPCCCSSPRPAS